MAVCRHRWHGMSVRSFPICKTLTHLGRHLGAVEHRIGHGMDMVRTHSQQRSAHRIYHGVGNTDGNSQRVSCTVSADFGITLDEVNWLGNLFSCTYLPISILIPAFCRRYGFRRCVSSHVHPVVLLCIDCNTVRRRSCLNPHRRVGSLRGYSS